MELVYLWVEEYKNIRNQGFNFSPRFECEFFPKYDKDGKLEKNSELKIKPKEYINIFPDNINVTAIVGKNGAGKSTIQKLIFLLIFLKKYENFQADNPIDAQKEDAIIEIFKNDLFKNKNIFLIINTNEGLKKLSLLQIIQNYDNTTINSLKTTYQKCYLKDKYDELKPKEIKFFSIHFHYMIDTWFDGYHTADDWTLKLYHRVDGFETPLLLEPYKGHDKENQYIDISNIEYLNNGKMFEFYGQLTKKLEFNKFFNPNYIWMMIDSNKLISKFKKFDGFPIENSVVKIIEDYINKLCKDKDLLSLNKIYAMIKIVHASNSNIFTNPNIIQEIKGKIVNISNDSAFKELIDSFSFDDLLKMTGLNETKKLESCVKFDSEIVNHQEKLDKYKDFLVLDPSKHTVNKIKEVYDIFENIVPWIEIELYQDEKGYSSLSSGEKAFLSFAMNVLYQIGNIKRTNDYKTINFFLDEVEYSMHPEWQKEFLKQVLILLKHFNEIQFNLYCATHSPFLLSDIPKENIIFLEDGKQVNPDITQTFGANIHTLLSDGFFMSNGLMGEFAKNKIEEIKKFYELIQKLQNKGKIKKELWKKSYDKRKTRFGNIQKIIGEPFLQTIIKNYLDELEILFNGKKEFLDKEIKRLQALQESLND